MAHYDLLVIGTGPAGQKAAIQAAKLGKKVGIVERKRVVGGVCTNTGTIPSKSLREAASTSLDFISAACTAPATASSRTSPWRT